jgi:hypothetical protein
MICIHKTNVSFEAIEIEKRVRKIFVAMTGSLDALIGSDLQKKIFITIRKFANNGCIKISL